MLMSHDAYEISVHYPIDKIHYRSIQLLYQPIIGFEAASVYLYLWSEVDQVTLTKAPCYHKRISKLLGMSLSMIASSLKKLEAIGLINTYKKEDAEVSYLYELLLPLSPNAFYKHQILNTLLYKIIGEEEYQRTQVCFTTYQVDTTKYKNITASFQDVFSIHLDASAPKPIVEKEHLRQEVNAIEKEYPLDLFYAGLADYQIKKNSITKEDETIIQQLGMLYKIHVLDMQRLVKQAMDKDRLHHQTLIKECRAYYALQTPETLKNIHYKQSIKHKSAKTNSTKDGHIQYLERISPFDLLKAKQGGKEPVRKDLVIIESLMTILGLEPGVINVLIEMTLKECDNTLPRGYMEHYGGQWKRKKITTVAAAIKEAKQVMKNKEKHKVVLPSLQENTYVEVNENTVDEEEFKKLLAEFD